MQFAFDIDWALTFSRPYRIWISLNRNTFLSDSICQCYITFHEKFIQCPNLVTFSNLPLPRNSLVKVFSHWTCEHSVHSMVWLRCNFILEFDSTHDSSEFNQNGKICTSSVALCEPRMIPNNFVLVFTWNSPNNCSDVLKLLNKMLFNMFSMSLFKRSPKGSLVSVSKWFLKLTNRWYSSGIEVQPFSKICQKSVRKFLV